MPQIVQQDGHTFSSSFYLLNTRIDTIYSTPWYFSISFQFCLRQGKQFKLSLFKGIHYLLPLHSPIYYSYITCTSHVPSLFTQFSRVIQAGNQRCLPPRPRLDGALKGKKKQGTAPKHSISMPYGRLLWPTWIIRWTFSTFSVPSSKVIGEKEWRKCKFTMSVTLWDSRGMWGERHRRPPGVCECMKGKVLNA